jgi:hypothetical protein
LSGDDAGRRDEHNRLTSVSLTSKAGIDTEENFKTSLSIVSRLGKVTQLLPLKEIAWERSIDLPNVPSDGYLKIELQRSDQPDIEARAYLPITPGTPIALDMRELPDGIAP